MQFSGSLVAPHGFTPVVFVSGAHLCGGIVTRFMGFLRRFDTRFFPDPGANNPLCVCTLSFGLVIPDGLVGHGGFHNVIRTCRLPLGTTQKEDVYMGTSQKSFP